MKQYSLLLCLTLLIGCHTGGAPADPGTNAVVITNSAGFPASSYRLPLDPNLGEVRQ